MRRLGWALMILGVILLVAGGIFTSLPDVNVVPEPTRRIEPVPAPFTPAPEPESDPRLRVAPVAKDVPTGRVLGVMRIPRFGADWAWTAREGASLDVIDRGPAHMPGTALPGAKGNAAFFAHRAGHGDPFLDFETLRSGDRVTFEQRGHRWVYRVTAPPRIIDVDDVWVIDPLPGRKMTLITCWPKYGSERRLYARLTLTERNQP